MEQKLAKYFFLYKELSKLHKDFEFGETPHSSAGFTEKLCCYLLGLEKAEGVKREYDLYNPNNKDETFEVKGTTSPEGTTTINPFSKFTFLLWVCS